MRKIFLTISCFFWLLCANGLQAQDAAYYKEKYTFASNLFAESKFDLARNIYRDLFIKAENNPYYFFAKYYSALCHFKTQNYIAATNESEALLKEASDWDQVNEVRWLLALSHFENGVPLSGLSSFASLSSEELKSKANSTKLFYLNKMSVDSLVIISDLYPDDRAIAELLFKKISPDTEQGILIKKNLASRFGFELPKEVSNVQVVSKRESKEIAVLLPFLVEGLSSHNLQPENKFALDLYQGMQIAVERLKMDSIDISLFAYDTRKDLGSLQKVLALEEMKNYSVFIGPLYPESIVEANAFAKKQNAILVNPISNKAGLMGNDQMYFLKPSLATQAKNGAKYALQAWGKDCTAYILYASANEEDSILAHSYRKSIEEQGGKVGFFHGLSPDKFGFYNIVTKLKEIPLKSNSHIVLFTADQANTASVMSAVQTSGLELPVIIHESWLGFKQVDLEKLERMKAYIIANDVIDYQTDSVDWFKGRYKEKYGVIPSNIAFQGFEAVYYFGKMLNKHGSFIAQELPKEPVQKSFLLNYLDYRGGRDNQYTSVYSFKDGKLVRMNPPLE